MVESRRKRKMLKSESLVRREGWKVQGLVVLPRREVLFRLSAFLQKNSRALRIPSLTRHITRRVWNVRTKISEGRLITWRV